MKVAIVHDWLVTYAGSERVLEQLVGLYPEADLFSLVDFLPEARRGCIHGKRVTTSFVQNLPFARKYYRSFLPLMPLAVEQFDLSAYDLVISSSHAVAKGVLTGPDQLHVCLCYSPIRYAWDLQHQYLKETGLNRGVRGLMAKMLLHYIRLWDYRTANGVDEFIAISDFVGRRIRKVYGRESTVVYPPVDLARFTLHATKEDYYVTASRLVPYKRVDLIVEAFAQMPDKKLVVIGDGPELAKIRALAGSNVEIRGHQPDDALLVCLQRARAFIFAAEEDFGIAPLEAQACGTPVIAYGKGAALETIRGLRVEHPTGIFFAQQEVQDVVDAVAVFERHREQITPDNCRRNALRFSTENFLEQFSVVVSRGLETFQARPALFLNPLK